MTSRDQASPKAERLRDFALLRADWAADPCEAWLCEAHFFSTSLAEASEPGFDSTESMSQYYQPSRPARHVWRRHWDHVGFAVALRCLRHLQVELQRGKLQEFLVVGTVAWMLAT